MDILDLNTYETFCFVDEVPNDEVMMREPSKYLLRLHVSDTSNIDPQVLSKALNDMFGVGPHSLEAAHCFLRFKSLYVGHDFFTCDTAETKIVQWIKYSLENGLIDIELSMEPRHDT